MPTLIAVGINFLAWATIQTITGYLVHRMPSKAFQHDSWLSRERGWERGGRTYERYLKVRRWKSFLPENGDFFAGGFNKKRLLDRSTEHLSAYAWETRRAELGHAMAVLCTPIFLLWNPLWAVRIMFVYAVAANVPCVVSQRYNRIRLLRVLANRASRLVAD